MNVPATIPDRIAWAADQTSIPASVERQRSVGKTMHREVASFAHEARGLLADNPFGMERPAPYKNWLMAH
jgi:hypothetical protein